MKKILSLLVLLVILLTGCSHLKKVNEIADGIAKTNKWFDYSYDVVENYDESGVRRYHVKFYYSIENDRNDYTVEYVITFENNDYIAEVVK